MSDSSCGKLHRQEALSTPITSDERTAVGSFSNLALPAAASAATGL